jgi:hypothetical protein
MVIVAMLIWATVGWPRSWLDHFLFALIVVGVAHGVEALLEGPRGTSKSKAGEETEGDGRSPGARCPVCRGQLVGEETLDGVCRWCQGISASREAETEQEEANEVGLCVRTRVDLEVESSPGAPRRTLLHRL